MSKSINRAYLMTLGLVLMTTMTAQAARMPQFLDVARNADGSVRCMTQADAIQYCLNQGAHLPSARELAQLAMSLGARGIVESCGSDMNCYPVNATNADGSSDAFNFSYTGYRRPAGELGRNWFLSSSVAPYDSNYVFYLYGVYGFVYHYYRGGDSAVSCVSDR
jgi:hypothetical protein